MVKDKDAKDKEPAKHHPKKPAKKHSAGQHKVFDIVPPGRAPAAANSRSVPPSIKPPVADVQFVPGAPRMAMASDPNAKKPLMAHQSIELATTEPRSETSGQPSPTELPPTPEVPVSADPELTEGGPAAAPEPPLPGGQRLAAEPNSTDMPASPEESNIPDEDEAKAGQIAVEQMVKTDEASTEHSSPEESINSASPDTIPADDKKRKSIDELLAESGAPQLESHEQAQASAGVIISHHKPKRSWLSAILIIIGILLIAVLVFDVLLDADIIRTDINVPHTNLL